MSFAERLTSLGLPLIASMGAGRGSCALSFCNKKNKKFKKMQGGACPLPGWCGRARGCGWYWGRWGAFLCYGARQWLGDSGGSGQQKGKHFVYKSPPSLPRCLRRVGSVGASLPAPGGPVPHPVGSPPSNLRPCRSLPVGPGGCCPSPARHRWFYLFIYLFIKSVSAVVSFCSGE